MGWGGSAEPWGASCLYGPAGTHDVRGADQQRSTRRVSSRIQGRIGEDAPVTSLPDVAVDAVWRCADLPLHTSVCLVSRRMQELTSAGSENRSPTSTSSGCRLRLAASDMFRRRTKTWRSR